MTVRLAGRVFVYTALIVMAVLVCLPLYWLLRSSLMDSMEIFAFPPLWLPPAFRWENYVEAMTSLPFLLYFKNTLLIVIPVLFGVALTSGLAAFAFARLEFPLKNFWFTLIIMTVLLPGIVTLIPTYIGWARLGLVNTFWPLIVPAFFGGGAFNIFLLRQFLLTIPKELDEAAIMDGASDFVIYGKIILPLIKPAMIVVLLFTFVGVWNDLLGQLVYLGDQKVFTVSLGLAQYRGVLQTPWYLLMAASAVVIAPAIAVFLLGQRYFMEGLTMTGIKG